MLQDEEIRLLQMELLAAQKENDSMSQSSLTKEQESALVNGKFIGLNQRLKKPKHFSFYFL